MTGILDGVRVLDVGRGIAGPMTAMLLADHGADVVRVEPPGGDGFGDGPARSCGTGASGGSSSTSRGGRSRRVPRPGGAGRRPAGDVPAGRDRTARHRRRHRAAVNGRLVYASITGYGRDTPDADRPGIEWLVTARTGLQWDQRGWYGTRMDHIMGTDLDEPGFDVPAGVEQTGCREGPIFLAVPWASIGATLLSVTAISAGLYVAERTGTGQHVETSLAQACIMMNAMGWQTRRQDAPELPPLVLRPAGAEGHLRRR